MCIQYIVVYTYNIHKQIYELITINPRITWFPRQLFRDGELQRSNSKSPWERLRVQPYRVYKSINQQQHRDTALREIYAVNQSTALSDSREMNTVNAMSIIQLLL
jgi:hypothetical protein